MEIGRLITTCEVQYVLHCSRLLYAHSNVEIQISEKRALLSSGIETGSAVFKAPDIPMCQIAPLCGYTSFHKYVITMLLL